MIINTIYGDLEIIKEQGTYYKQLKRGKTKIVMSLVKCHCGKEFIGRNADIKRGKKISCGCAYKRKKEFFNIPAQKHGMAGTKIYNVFRGMKQRCNNKNRLQYKDWGGRGIKVLWNSFEDFYKDMGPTYKEGLTIERINNDGNYEQSNCKWATYKEQANNKRNSLSNNLTT